MTAATQQQDSSPVLIVGIAAFVVGVATGALGVYLGVKNVDSVEKIPTAKVEKASPEHEKSLPDVKEEHDSFAHMESKPHEGGKDAHGKEDADEHKEVELSADVRRHMLSIDFLSLLQDADISRYRFGGETRGVLLRRIRTGSVYEKAGFRDGDIIEQVNGIAVASLENSKVEAAKLALENPVKFRVRRGDRVISLKVRLVGEAK